jgi:hypothetical protein
VQKNSTVYKRKESAVHLEDEDEQEEPQSEVEEDGAVHTRDEY